MSDNIIHFETVWQEAEEVGSEAKRSRQEIYSSIKLELEEYKKIDNISSPEIGQTLKTKKMGEILFKLAELSHLDEINTYAALQMEIEYQKND